SNKNMLYSIGISIVMCMVVIYVPGINDFLKFAPLHLSDWITIAVSAMIFLTAHEILKFFKRRKAV
ncbi:MAG: cation transporting ATPase C-terminal domain-containing protein, partial [Candidatus Delongbacteria bacterium]|nr:cation transporting ATPase C-terminal domain-containing protein [Candidatus Delongbacteria bacterium]